MVPVESVTVSGGYTRPPYVDEFRTAVIEFGRAP